MSSVPVEISLYLDLSVKDIQKQPPVATPPVNHATRIPGPGPRLDAVLGPVWIAYFSSLAIFDCPRDLSSRVSPFATVFHGGNPVVPSVGDAGQCHHRLYLKSL